MNINYVIATYNSLTKRNHKYQHRKYIKSSFK